ncbi:family 16 glycosylhydrolase [Granulicella sp. 5B5]|uniref:glycoside hydrolase family 16 protein n=1 Tax=Granulicella sp. 5B5 TaxID=1617967 RepID=UPI00176259C9|nr:glycoside hydrolase family 16 protein [Granulicella sp. 5B5]QMV19616.1 family 16 glycosylhydrolase [Granulicella sp. 5B5]
MRTLLTLLAALLFTGIAQAQTWHLVWSDEFNGPANSLPSATDWDFERGWGPQGNHEIEWYCQPHEHEGPCDDRQPNAFLDGQGHLVLHAIHHNQLWSSARLNTQGKHTLLYGRVEARLRMEPGAGFWPAFWLLGDNIDKVGWPTSGEQDIMEWVQKYGPNTTSSTLHGPGYSGGKGISHTYTFPAVNGVAGRIDDGNFHTYGMTWSKDRMEFYRDDPAKPYAVITPADLPPGTHWVYNHPFFVILNFAVGEAGFAGTVDATTPPTGRMWVDYVRFYQLQ